MLKLMKKYVFHIPLFKYQNTELVKIDIDKHLKELIENLNDEGFESFYITSVKNYYKSRCFEELLLTLFTLNHESPEIIFLEWFKKKNHILKQEAVSYECNGSMFVEKF